MAANLKLIVDRAQEARERLREWDAHRTGFTGEHWIVLTSGLLLFMATRRSNMAVKLAGSVLGSMLLIRAATGRHGLEQKRWLPL